MNWPLETVAELRDEKDNRPFQHQIRRPRLTARQKNPQKNHSTEMKALQTPGAKISADTEIAIIRHVFIVIFTSAIFDMLRKMRSQAKSQRSKLSDTGGVKGSVASLKESFQLGCVSQDSYPRKSILREGRL